jgi:serine protease Do
MRKSGAVAALAVMLLTPTWALAQDSTSPTAPAVTDQEKVVAYAQPSVVYLDVTWTAWVFDTFGSNDTYLNNGQPFVLYSSCTGFFVNDTGNIATAGHCVDPAGAVDAFYDAAARWVYATSYYQNDFSLAQIRGFAEEDYRIEGEKKSAGGRQFEKGAEVDVQAVWSTSSTEPLYDSSGSLNGEPHEARLVRFLPGDEGDVALLKVEVANTPALPVLDAAIDTGAEVTSIGYPAAVMAVSDANLSDPSFKPGTISSVRTNRAYPVYEMSTPMSSGMSGGPTVIASGDVIGVNSYGISAQSQSFEFSQSSQTLLELMRAAGVENKLGEVGTTYRAGLDAYFAGNKADAVKNLEATVDAAPQFAMAEEYLDLAKDLPNPLPPDEGTNFMLPIIGAVVTLGGLAVGVSYLARRRKRKPEPAPSAAVAMTVAPPAPPAPPRETGTDVLGGFVREGEPTKVMLQAGWYCTSCGQHVASSEAKFCGRCGTPRDEGVSRSTIRT